MKQKMFASKTLLAGLALSSLISVPAMADQSAGSEFVDHVSLGFPGQAAVIHIKNTSANKNVNAINLAVQESKMDFKLSAATYCDPGIHVRFKGGFAFFGPVNLGGGGQLQSGSALYGDIPIDMGYSEKKNDIVEYTESTFSVPLSKVKSGSATLKVDPIAELNKKLQQHINNGGKAVNFYRNEQQILIHRPISVAGICGNNSNNTVGYYTKDHAIQIIYEGDKDVFDHKLNEQMGESLPGQIKQNTKPTPVVPMGGNGIGGGYQPLKITDANILADTLSYTGQCPKELKFTTRINGVGRGGVKYMVHDGIKNVKSSGSMIYDAKNGWLMDNFTFTIPVEQQKINQTVNHKFRLTIEYRDGQAQGLQWDKYEKNFELNWTHKCTPQTKFQMGGQQNGGVKFNNQPPSPPINNIKAQPLSPSPQPARPVQAQPPKPDPAPKLQLKAVPQPEEKPARAQ